MNPSIEAFLKHYSAKLEDSHLRDKLPHLLSAAPAAHRDGALAFGDERKGDEHE
jgi:hypothetical protein